MGMISGRKSFQKSFEEGVELLHAIQDVYMEKKIDIA
jgi:class I fructose-bisphosphate aldolase